MVRAAAAGPVGLLPHLVRDGAEPGWWMCSVTLQKRAAHVAHLLNIFTVIATNWYFPLQRLKYLTSVHDKID